jgi:cytochrome c
MWERVRSACRLVASRFPVMILALALTWGCHEASGREAHVAVAGGDPDRGKTAIATFGCGSCHTIPGIATAKGTAGPPLFFIRWIEVPQAIEPGTAMPNLGVPEGDARDIAAYLYTLR